MKKNRCFLLISTMTLLFMISISSACIFSGSDYGQILTEMEKDSKIRMDVEEEKEEVYKEPELYQDSPFTLEQIDAAIKWALDKEDIIYNNTQTFKNQAGYYGGCLPFVVDAYRLGAGVTGIASYGYPINAEEKLKFRDNYDSQPPPRGSWVFYVDDNNHVALSLGEGKIVHCNTVNPNKAIVEVDDFQPGYMKYSGWAWPK